MQLFILVFIQLALKHTLIKLFYHAYAIGFIYNTEAITNSITIAKSRCISSTLEPSPSVLVSIRPRIQKLPETSLVIQTIHAFLRDQPQAPGLAPSSPVPLERVGVEVKPTKALPAHVAVEKCRPDHVYKKIPPELTSVFHYVLTQIIVFGLAVKVDALPAA